MECSKGKVFIFAIEGLNHDFVLILNIQVGTINHEIFKAHRFDHFE